MSLEDEGGDAGASTQPSDAADGGSSSTSSALPVWHGVHKLSSGKRRAKTKKDKQKRVEDLGDVSEVRAASRSTEDVTVVHMCMRAAEWLGDMTVLSGWLTDRCAHPCPWRPCALQALRREFVQYAIAGIARSLQNATSQTSRLATEFISRREPEGSSFPRPATSSPKSSHSGGSSGGHSRGGGGDGCANGGVLGEGGVEMQADGTCGGGHAAHTDGGRHTPNGKRGHRADGQISEGAFTKDERTELAPNVQFRDLAPSVFAQLRTGVFGLSDDECVLPSRAIPCCRHIRLEGRRRVCTRTCHAPCTAVSSPFAATPLVPRGTCATGTSRVSWESAMGCAA